MEELCQMWMGGYWLMFDSHAPDRPDVSLVFEAAVHRCCATNATSVVSMAQGMVALQAALAGASACAHQRQGYLCRFGGL